MPSPQVHAESGPLIISGVIGIIAQALMPEYIVIFLCALLGAGIGLAFRESPIAITSKNPAFIFVANAAYVLFTSLIVCAVLVLILGSDKLTRIVGIFNLGAMCAGAFLAGIGLMIYRERILKRLGIHIDGV